MKKIVRKIGDSKGIIFNKEESEIYNIKINDTLSFEIENKKEVKQK